MIYLIEFILIGPLNVAMAWWHSRLIKANRPIQHGWWALVFMFPVAGVILWQWHTFPSAWSAIAFLVACLVGRLVVFNIALNRFRGLPWNYLGEASVTDRIERRLFGTRIWLAEVILGAIFIILQLFLL